MKIMYITMNKIFTESDILYPNFETEARERWGMTLTADHRNFSYDLTFETEQHETLFLLQFGHLL